MSHNSGIYSAVYSGVPVFEMVINDIAVMRRRTDSYMNATQILKVANIEKGKRTKILEKEVLIGEHEKVQGGYGKYQGTWIPFEKSKELAIRYEVDRDLAPLFEFDYNVAASVDDDSLLTKEMAMVAKRKHNSNNTSSSQPTTDTKKHPLPSHQPKQSSQIHTLPHKSDGSLPVRKKAKAASSTPTAVPYSKPAAPNVSETMNDPAEDEQNRSILMSIFLSDKPEHIPELLQNPQNRPNFNIDMIIDEQGHSALHWAAALARAKTVELLVSKGANISYTNYNGETPLMRAVMVTNNYDEDSFNTVFELLKGSISVTDSKKRNVLHHAALTSGIQGRSKAATYYIQVVTENIKVNNAELKSLLDSQDSLGDTAVNIAAKFECQDIVDTLVSAGAAEATENNIGLRVKDYKESNSVDTQMEEATSTQRTFATSSSYSGKPYAPSQRGKEIVATVQKIVDALDDEYGAQLEVKEKELQNVLEDLSHVTHMLEFTRKGLEERQAQSQKLSEAQQKTLNIANALEAGRTKLAEMLKKANKPIPSANTTADMPESDEDIDTAFNIPELDLSADLSEEERKKQTEEYVKKLQIRVKAYTKNDQDLEQEIKQLEDQFTEKEMQCKRLIAACCNLPIEKIDDLVEPLTLAIESDPPDLDLARVIGFMDKIRRQGAFVESIADTTSSTPLQQVVNAHVSVSATTSPSTSAISYTITNSEIGSTDVKPESSTTSTTAAVTTGVEPAAGPSEVKVETLANSDELATLISNSPT